MKKELQKAKKNNRGNRRGNGSNNDSNRSDRNKTPEWKKKAPKEGEENEKVVNHLQYYWCPNHKSWTRHKPSECKGIKHRMSKEEREEAKKKAQDERKERKLQLDRALASRAQQESSDDE